MAGVGSWLGCGCGLCVRARVRRRWGVVVLMVGFVMSVFSLAGRSRVLVAWCAALVLLLVDGLAASAGMPAVPGPVPAVSAPAGLSSPDEVSARVQARATGQRVEVLGLRSESSSTWVNPDGSLTSEIATAPVRFRDRASGSWRDVDLSLVKAGKLVVPAGSSSGVSFSAGGVAGSDLVGVDHGPGRSVSWVWDRGPLPAPVLDGQSATYRDAAGAGVDVRVSSRPRGFEQDFVIRDAAALAQVPAGGWQVPVRTKGLTAVTRADGSTDFVDAKGKVVSRIPGAMAWDSNVDARSGDPASSPVKVSVAQRNPGQAVVSMVPDRAWLTDPARVFPIVIDPTYASVTVAPSFDTWVENTYATDQSGSTELKVGSFDGGSTVARSFINFPISGFRNLQVMSASLSLYETWSSSCTASGMNVFSAAPASTATRWTAQPAVGTSVLGSVTVAKGFSSGCPAGRVSVPVTGLMQYWAAKTDTYGGLMLKAANESDNLSWKRFASMETSTPPVFTVTYNRKPTVPSSAPTVPSSVAQGVLGGVLYVGRLNPSFTAPASDPDGNKVMVEVEVHTNNTDGPYVAGVTKCAATVASGTTATCTIPINLTNNATYYARTHVQDDQGLWGGYWSPWLTFRTATTVPAAPVISCPAPYTNGSWQDNAPSTNVACTVTAVGTGFSAPSKVTYALDGTAVSVAIPQSSSTATAKATITVPKTEGSHSITGAKAYGPAGVASAAAATYSFGYGKASMVAPAVGSPVTTTGLVSVVANGPPRGTATTVTGQLKWRVAGSGDNELVGWNPVGTPLVITPGLTTGTAVFPTWWNTMDADVDQFLDSDPSTAGVQPTTLNDRVPTRLDVQVCFVYTGSSTMTQCTWSTSKVTVNRVPHAFGTGFPTTGAGPGQVALFTGEYNQAVTDVSVPGYTGALSLGRSHSTYGNSGSGFVPAAQSVFGPGWTADLQGSTEGLAGLVVTDGTGLDGSIVFTDTDGSASVYATPAGTRRTTAALPTGTYVPVDEDTIASGTTLTVTGTGTATTLTLTEDDGTATVFVVPGATDTDKAARAPGVGKAGVFQASTVTVPGTGATTYTYDAAGRVTRILAPIPTGLAGSACPDGPVTGLSPGCRALRLSYATTTDGTDVAGQVTSAAVEIYNPDPALSVTSCAGTTSTPGTGMVSVPVACYRYTTTSKQLASVTDPRSGLAVAYTYGPDNQLATITPPGQPAYTLTYTTTAGQVRLTGVSRPTPATAGGGTTALTRIAYNVPTSGAGLPDLSDTHTAIWDQTGSAGAPPAPTYAAAVFGPDYPGGWDPAVANSGVTDWTYGDFSYTDRAGYTTNTASYGAGQWLYSYTRYDGHGNVVFTMSPDGISRHAAAEAAAGVNLLPAPYGTTTVYNDTTTGTTPPAGLPANTAAGSVVTDTYGPARDVVLPDGTTMWARPRTHTSYDQGAPNAGIAAATGLGYALPTSTTVTADPPANTTGDAPAGAVIARSFTGYTDPGGANSTSAASGWTLRAATSRTTDMNLSGTLDAGDITARTLYDAEGRVVESRQPASAGGDAGTTLTRYYTVGANSADAACGNKPAWAGLMCHTVKAAAAAGTTLPDSTITGYSYLLAPTTTVETSGTVTRTSTSSYLLDGRTDTTRLTVTGLGDAATTIPATTTVYDPATGAATGTTTVGATPAQTTSSTRDSWGRVISYTTAQGDTTTTTYDGVGRVVSVVDPKGTTSYTYDGTDAVGNTERRGLTTALTVTRGNGQGNLTYKGAYDVRGNLTRQDLPGQLTMGVGYDDAGQPTALTYTGQVTPVTETVNPDGTTTWTPGTPGRDVWFAWTHDRDTTGRIVRDYTSAGAGFDGLPGVTNPADETAPAIARGTGSDRAYSYDQAGRLTRVTDRTATVTGTTVAPDVPATPAIPCTVRTYGFDANGNRTSIGTATHNDGDCTTTPTTTTTLGYDYDTADRPLHAATPTGTGAAYTYDLLGRQTLLPAADAPNPALGDVTLGYYDTDQPRTVTQNGSTTTYAMDLTGRRTTATTAPTSGGTPTNTTVRHYADTSDNPAWSTTTTAAGTTTTRYSEDLTGNLGATITPDGTTNQPLATIHGDIATTITIPTGTPDTAPATTCTGWSDYTEYGTPRDPTATTTIAGDLGYGWLGAKQRSTTPESAGLTLMGDRYYNPVTGRFTSLDPEKGGNTTSYTYPQDPIGASDLDGHRRRAYWRTNTFLRRPKLAQHASYRYRGISRRMGRSRRHLGDRGHVWPSNNPYQSIGYSRSSSQSDDTCDWVERGSGAGLGILMLPFGLTGVGAVLGLLGAAGFGILVGNSCKNARKEPDDAWSNIVP